MNGPSRNQNHELGEAVQDLSKAFDLLKDVYDTSQKRYESLTREIKNDHEKESIRQRRDAWLIALISIFGIGLSVIAASYWSYQQKKVELQQTLNERLNDQVTQIEDQIKDLFTRKDQLMDAMTQVRSVRDEGQRQCKNGIYSGNDPIGYRKRLLASTFDLVGAYYKTTGLFNENIKNKILLFNSLADIDKLNICEKGTAVDLDLRNLQASINVMMLNYIETLETQKRSLLTKIRLKGDPL